MTRSTKTRALTMGSALVLAAGGVLGGGVADADSATTTCTPTTRTLDTLEYATPLALSPRGHVVTQESNPGAIGGLWLHRPNGTKTPITFSDGSSPYGVSDVNLRGSAVGTQGVNVGAIAAGVPWISRGATASRLPDPTRDLQSKFATSINKSGVVAGAATNYPYSSPGGTAFAAIPIVWPDAATNPVDLPMPTGYYAIAFDRGEPLVSIRNDGVVSAVLVDQNGGGSYLARWATVTSAPLLNQLPVSWHPVAVAGRWVVGRGGAFTGDMFVWSPTAAVTLHPDHSSFSAMDVSASGTYFGVVEAGTAVDIEAIIGRGVGTPRVGGSFTDTVDVAGSQNGQLLVDSTGAAQVVSCALSSPASTHVDVTPVVVG